MPRQAPDAIRIDGKPYRLARDKAKAPMWQPMPVPTQEGDPRVPRFWKWNDWSRGMGDSRGVFPGAVELANLAHVGHPGRLLPGPNINTIATSSDGPVKDLVVVTAPANRILAVGGRYVPEINPTTHAVATTEDLGAGTSAVSAVLFIDHVAIALGDSTLFKKRNAAGAYADNTLTGNYRYARAFGISAEGDLVRGRTYNWSKCSAADFYATDNNWTTDYDIGDRSGNINSVFAFQRADYVVKDEGVYSFDQVTSKEMNVLPGVGNFRSSDNRGWFTKDNRLFLCTFSGLVRLFHLGPARNAGPEELPYNESVLADVYPTAGASLGKWHYTAYYDGSTTTYIVLERDAQDGDAAAGPVTQVEIIDSFTGRCDAMIIPSDVTSVAELWYGRGTGSVAWVKLRRDGRPAEYQTGTTTVDFAPTNFGRAFTLKYFKSIEAVGRNVDANRTITVKGKNDGGSQYTVGSAIASLTNRYAQKFWTAASNDNAREAQFTVELANNNSTTPPELRELILNYEERPTHTDGFVAVLDLSDFAGGRGQGQRRTAQQQRQDLAAVLDAAPVTIIDPEGTSFTGALVEWTGESESLFRGERPQQNITIQVRKLDYA